MRHDWRGSVRWPDRGSPDPQHVREFYRTLESGARIASGKLAAGQETGGPLAL